MKALILFVEDLTEAWSSAVRPIWSTCLQTLQLSQDCIFIKTAMLSVSKC